MKAIHLHRLHIERNPHNFAMGGIPANSIGGTIVFGNSAGHKVELQLSQEHIDRILSVVADSMVETTRELANDLTRDVIDSMNTDLQICSADPYVEGY